MHRAQSATDISRLLNHDHDASTDGTPSLGFHIDMDMTAMADVPPEPGTMSDTFPALDPPAELPRPYKCPIEICEKAFHRLEHLTRHIRTHTGEKPHACSFVGCTKRFSRSDELTRHLRIHTNPRRKGPNLVAHLAQQAVAAHAHHIIDWTPQKILPAPLPALQPRPLLPQQPQYSQRPRHPQHPQHLQHLQQPQQPQHLQQSQQPPPHPPHHRLLQPPHDDELSHLQHFSQLSQSPDVVAILPPPAPRTVRSAPPSGMSSPIISPPQLLPLGFQPVIVPPGAAGYPMSCLPAHSSSGVYQTRPVVDHNLFPPAATYTDRTVTSSHPSPIYYYQGHNYSTYPVPAPAPSVAFGAFSGSSTVLDEHYRNVYRQPKRSRPNSPISTAPPSPTFSHPDSPSPTLTFNTPAPTPGPSPRLRPAYLHVELPTLRSLSLHPPASLGTHLAPLEPSLDSCYSTLPSATTGPVVAMTASSPASAPRTHNISLMEILHQSDEEKRTLPVPLPTAISRVTVQDLLSGPL